MLIFVFALEVMRAALAIIAAYRKHRTSHHPAKRNSLLLEIALAVVSLLVAVLTFLEGAQQR